MTRTLRRSAGALLLAALLGTLSAGATVAQASPAGDWEGALTVPTGAELPLVLHITEDEDGALAATLDSPAQGAYGIEGADVAFEEGALTIQFPSIQGTYEATLSEDGDTLSGTWSQGPQSLALELTRAEGEAD